MIWLAIISTFMGGGAYQTAFVETRSHADCLALIRTASNMPEPNRRMITAPTVVGRCVKIAGR